MYQPIGGQKEMKEIKKATKNIFKKYKENLKEWLKITYMLSQVSCNLGKRNLAMFFPRANVILYHHM